MNSETTGSDPSLQVMFEKSGRMLTWSHIGANLVGAGIVTSYFVFFDRVFPAIQIQNTFYVVGLMFPVLVLIAISSMRHWQKDLNLFIRLHSQNREIGVDLQKKRSTQNSGCALPVCIGKSFLLVFSGHYNDHLQPCFKVQWNGHIDR